MSVKIDYRKINKNFNVVDLLTTDNPIRKEMEITNVIHSKGKSTSNLDMFYVQTKGVKERIVVYPFDKEKDKKRDYPFFYNPNFDEDKGCVVQFIENRVGKKRCYELLDKYDVIRNTKHWERDVFVSNMKRGSKKKVIPLKFNELSGIVSLDADIEMKNSNYLIEERAINPSVLLSDKFRGTIYKFFDSDVSGHSGEAILFPTRSIKGEIKGGEIRRDFGDEDYKMMYRGDPHILFYSNKPEEVSKVVITESPIDCLSHYQLFKKSNHNTWYFSSRGNLTDGKLNFLYKMLAASKVDIRETVMVGAFDNDEAGYGYDLSFLNSRLKDARYYFDNLLEGKIWMPAFAFENKDYSENGVEHDRKVWNRFLQLQDKLNKLTCKKLNYFAVPVSKDGKYYLNFGGEEIKKVFLEKNYIAGLVQNIYTGVKLKIQKPKGIEVKDWNDILVKNLEQQKNLGYRNGQNFSKK